VVTLYNRDAVDVRALLLVVAEIFKGDPDGNNSSMLLGWRESLAKAHSAASDRTAAAQQANLAAGRLTSIADAIKEQLPPELREELPRSLRGRRSGRHGSVAPLGSAAPLDSSA
jgi:hypothetical protein